MDIYQKRRADMATWMARQSIALVIFEDTEGRRDPAVRYFTGQPGDAVLAVSIDGKALLSPWDENMAEKLAQADEIIPLEAFERNPIAAAAGLAQKLGVPESSRIEIPGTTAYPHFLRYVDTLSGYDVLCRDNGAHTFVSQMRAVKDSVELEHIRRAAKITDDIIDNIETKLLKGGIRSETDVAMLIERECREAGCEGTGFETLAAGPERSFGIHCFPTFTGGVFPGEGLSILDFGVKWEGYTSDVTLTVAAGNLSAAQKKQLSLVEKAYNAALELYMPGVPSRAPAVKADEVFAKEKRAMPHALGHGIGLEAHEGPSIRSRKDNDWVFVPGMVTTLEPGLYDPKLGGCRLENDILITDTGNEVLTHSRIIRM